MIPLFRVSTNVEGALDNVGEVLQSGYVGQGQWCEKFEQELRARTGHPHLLYVNSGTSALQLAFYLAGARPGTEVISTPITCLATNTAIVANGAKIVWADVDVTTGNIDVVDAASKVTHRTRAIVGVDWGGRLCAFNGLRLLTRGVTLIEDAAHAMLTDPKAGRGDFICYSLQAIKHLHTADGGLLACPSPAMFERAKLLRWFGLDRTRSDSMRCYQPVAEAGWKMQGNDVLAAIGCANLVGLEDRVAACRKNAEWYWNRLGSLSSVALPPPDSTSSWWLYTLRVSHPPSFENFMAARGIAVGQVHARNDLYSCFSESRLDLPGVDAFAAHQVSIPVGWWLTTEDLETVAKGVEAWARTPQAAWLSRRADEVRSKSGSAALDPGLAAR